MANGLGGRVLGIDESCNFICTHRAEYHSGKVQTQSNSCMCTWCMRMTMICLTWTWGKCLNTGAVISNLTAPDSRASPSATWTVMSVWWMFCACLLWILQGGLYLTHTNSDFSFWRMVNELGRGKICVIWWIDFRMVSIKTSSELSGGGCKGSHGGRCFLNHFSALTFCFEGDLLFLRACRSCLGNHMGQHDSLVGSNVHIFSPIKVGSDFARPKSRPPTVCGYVACIPSQWCVSWLFVCLFVCLLDGFLAHVRPQPLTCVNVRFASIYHYDWNLFKERFIGPDGVPWSTIELLQHRLKKSSYMTGHKALESFWESVKNEDWFLQHPILSSPDPWSTLVWFSVMLCCADFLAHVIFGEVPNWRYRIRLL